MFFAVSGHLVTMLQIREARKTGTLAVTIPAVELLHRIVERPAWKPCGI